MKLKGRGFMCSVVGCNRQGEVCTIDCYDEDGTYAGEAEMRLCEDHWVEMR